MVKQLVIIEKYNEFTDYIYPCVQNIQRKHGTIKQEFTKLMFFQIELFYKGLKSNQISKLYEADANLATLRYYLRFFASDKRKLISNKQHQRASILLSEVGSILNSWINQKKGS